MAPVILVVDDNQEFLLFARQALVGAGYTVVTAGDGQAGLDYVASNGLPDLIVSDVHMPGMSGIELARRLRGNPETTKARVIIVSSDPAARRDAERVGALGFLPKLSGAPVQSLIEEVRRHVGR